MDRWRVWLATAWLGGCGDDVGTVDHDETSSTSAASGESSETGATSVDDGSSGAAETTVDSTGEPPAMPGEGPFGGGTRLSAVVEHGDGAAHLRHWYDRELGIECGFARDAAGVLRCLPLAVPGVSVGFTDAECSTGVMQAESCGATPSFVRTTAPGAASCNDGVRQLSYRRGGPMAAPEDFYDWSPFSGGCGTAGDIIGDHYAVDRIADDQFLAAQYVEIDAGGPLAVRAMVAEDGSWERADLVDLATGAPCRGQPVPIDAKTVLTVCAPQGVGRTGNVFAAADCTGESLVAVPDDGTCQVPQIASDGEDWWSFGPVYEGETYELYQGECYPTELDPDAYAVYERGEPIDPPIAAAYEREPVTQGEGERLQPYGVVVDGVPTLLTRHEYAFYDAVLMAHCTPVARADGGRVCAHASHDSPAGQWGDPECTTQPLYRSFFPEDALPPIVVGTEYDGCRELAVDARTVVGPWEEAVYERNPETGACTLDDNPDDPAQFLQLGNSVQLDDLPQLVIETIESED